MAGLLISDAFSREHGDRLRAVEHDLRLEIEHLVMPEDADERVSQQELQRATLTFFSNDIYPGHSRQFFSAALSAPNLEWMQVFSAGIDFPLFQQILQKGIRVTTGSGSSAVPIAHTAIGGLLALSRGFPSRMDAQRRKSWEPIPDDAAPLDLASQTIVVIGVGAIGAEICRLGQALGLRVIGVRRSPRTEADPVDEMYPPSALGALYPRADWLAIAAPLTEQTRGLVDAAALDLLPKGARVLNVGRGPIIDEGALIERLTTGALGGAWMSSRRSHSRKSPPSGSCRT